MDAANLKYTTFRLAGVADNAQPILGAQVEHQVGKLCVAERPSENSLALTQRRQAAKQAQRNACTPCCHLRQRGGDAAGAARRRMSVAHTDAEAGSGQGGRGSCQLFQQMS